jgi:hypothetical protein
LQKKKPKNLYTYVENPFLSEELFDYAYENLKLESKYEIMHASLKIVFDYVTKFGIKLSDK